MSTEKHEDLQQRGKPAWFKMNDKTSLKTSTNVFFSRFPCFKTLLIAKQTIHSNLGLGVKLMKHFRFAFSAKCVRSRPIGMGDMTLYLTQDRFSTVSYYFFTIFFRGSWKWRRKTALRRYEILHQCDETLAMSVIHWISHSHLVISLEIHSVSSVGPPCSKQCCQMQSRQYSRRCWFKSF